MKRNIFLICLLLIAGGSAACRADSARSANENASALPSVDNSVAKANENKPAEATGNQAASEKKEDDKSFSNPVADQPRTVRDFFMLLPQKYFALEPPLTKKEYLKRFLVVEDTANGYLEGSGDGAQGGLTMALFKRPDASYIVGLNTFHEADDNYYFLEYKNGQWFDISAKAVPNYSKKNIYKLPRQGTTVQVFAKKILEKGADYELSEQGAKLYDLAWKDGKFTIQK